MEEHRNAVRALNTAIELGNSLFPENEIAVYVPPSNILSEEGRRLLHDEFPQIKVIASLYLEGQIEYAQEFEVAEDGVIEFPRVISGALLDQYMRWDALNALNLYYVNSHFMHPWTTYWMLTAVLRKAGRNCFQILTIIVSGFILLHRI